ncbi:hypothetical protein DealDRAFT_1676 [Dethiobacter alkaliphilus AHT 1]|uniref:Uncharacterized protein n=1 Tax=Dethiobacter alkaliphilus AHT 1 TaxID=555088 RepID=C0GGW2_DETAL|nr:hypothetical protein DealDRAFT_1676 [Dethiobacter alkaliphilus AHT 1]
MLTQFGRLLERIAKSNEKVFQGKPLKVYTINQSQESQMAKLRMIRNDSKQAPRRAPICAVSPMQGRCNCEPIA